MRRSDKVIKENYIIKKKKKRKKVRETHANLIK